MKRTLVFILLCGQLFTTLAQSQVARVSRHPAAGRGQFNPELQPFYHGVASGDPTANSVLIWTRVTPDAGQSAIDGTWFVAADTAFTDVVATGAFTAAAERDYAVKVNVDGLAAGSTYYYYFQALGANSLIGRAKTCPAADQVDQLKFAVVSCSNYEAGYFNAYGAIARRNDLDAVIHLGDYIYEYGTGTYGIPTPGRSNEPPNEIVTLADYRTRYSLYRLDEDLIRLHQQHTFINIWDDHESANGAYAGGADNHQSDEGPWEVRKAVSKQVYFEWIPIRDNDDTSVYRKIAYGDLCDLIMIDTRLEGRDATPPHFDTPDDPPRHMISTGQYFWLMNHLQQSQARWKVIGNQVLFSDYNVGFMAGPAGMLSITAIRAAEDQFMGHWESFPTQRNALIESLRQYDIDNVVILTGDSHSSWAFDVTQRPVLYPLDGAQNLPQPNPYNPATGQGYDPSTGQGSWAVEFAAPSISSPNYDEAVGNLVSNQVEQQMNHPTTLFNVNYNPHLKYVDLDRHGYFLLDLNDDAAQADYYYVPTVKEPTNEESFGQAMLTLDEENHLRPGTSPAAPKPVQDVPAPLLPLSFTPSAVASAPTVAVFSCYPNPTAGNVFLQLGLRESADAEVNVYDLAGRRVLEVLPAQELPAGIYNFSVAVGSLPNGAYVLRVERPGGQLLAGQKIVVGK